MNPLTANFLRAAAALATHAQANPTDVAGLRARREARNRAEAAWAQAGAPDAPPGSPMPTLAPDFVARVAGRHAGEEEKDWARVPALVEVQRVTEKALLLRDGRREFWCPRSLLTSETELIVGAVADIELPAWVLADPPRPVTPRREA